MEVISTIDNGCIIEEVDTFIFSMPKDYALGHCVAKDMRMSAGIATKFKLTFGRVGELMDQRRNVGDVAYLQQDGRFIYYLITKDYSHKKPTYNSLTSAIIKLRDFIVKHSIKKLAIPRIGCGLDKLYWPKVKNIIKCAFLGVGCLIKVCHFTPNMANEKEILRVNHPSILRIRCQNSIEMEKLESKKLNFILYSRSSTSPGYWDQHFELVNKKYSFKSQYFKDFEVGHEIGKCLHYDTIKAHVYVIITNKYITDHFSYQNFEKGLLRIKSMIKNNRYRQTFVIQKINKNIRFEILINQKIVSLISSIFVELAPCVVIELNNNY